MNALLFIVLALLALLLMGLLLSYRWTFTPLGRLDYAAAVLSKLASLHNARADMSPAARASANRFATFMIPKVKEVLSARFEDRVIDAADGTRIPIRIYWPSDTRTLPLYLDIHGGGWWMGDGYFLHEHMRLFAQQSHCIVVSVDYRLAPEHPYPAALDDCYETLQWMHKEASQLGADPDRIAVGGGSAGGNLAAALTLRARDQGGPRISFQSLVVPVTDLSGRTQWQSYHETGNAYMLKVSSIQEMIDAYVPQHELRDSAWVSPLLADSLAGLPPALIVTAQFDPLRDQGEAYAKRLQAANVPVRLHCEQGAIHGFLGSNRRFLNINSLSAEAVKNAFGAA